jgi:aconitase B
LPIITIQTTRTKAAEIVDRIQSAGGLLGICFNPIADSDGTNFDLGILQLADGEMQLFGEFYTESAIQIDEQKKWHQQSQKTKGYCGLIIAHGLTGKAREHPGIKETIAFLEAKSLSNDDLGLGTLQLMPDS